MERLPFAMRAMTKAAVEAGLIDGSLTQQKQEEALNKLRDNGKLISSVVLPNFGHALRELANNGDAVAKALQNNLAPQLGRSKNVLVDLTNEIYKGLKPALHFVLTSFADLGEDSNNLAYYLGKVLGGAVFAITFPFKMLGAVILDVITLLDMIIPLSDESKRTFFSWAATIAGAAAGVWVLVKALSFAVAGMKALTSAKRAAEKLNAINKNATTAGDVGGKAGRAGKIGGAARTIGSGIGRVAMGGLGMLASKPAMIAAAVAALGFAGYKGYQHFTGDKEKDEQKVKVEVDIKATDQLFEVTDKRILDVSKRMAENVVNNYIDQTLTSIPDGGGS